MVRQVAWMAVVVHVLGVYDNPFAFLRGGFVRAGILQHCQGIDW
jgi:hypothetical protein